MDKRVGITATVPVEIILAAGLRPVDLNNIFINAEDPKRLVAKAEEAGFARNVCTWIKGIYATVLEKGFWRVVAVTGGDCSNTIALGEVLGRRGVEIIHFEYPLDRSARALRNRMEALAGALGATWESVEKARGDVDRIRRKLKRLDEMTYREGRVSGFENHLFLVGSSDFDQDPVGFEARLDAFLDKARSRPSREPRIRLGFLGVPPIFSGFYEAVEAMDAQVVFNEVQRQFSMPDGGEALVETYLRYTYPYDMAGRIADIRTAVAERRLDGLIHYTQTFCYRQIYDILLREGVDTPILTLEGDQPGPLDNRTLLRIETFCEMLKSGKDMPL
ncbi:(R)-2-hydroxyacyl-CoA dehydratase [uncultured Desulfatiglans sp.]|uniref:(R)-2-hydroxyacyl-CoA dehydratase n=1 Tax=Uncultured Desulfatiglans sp. TaxID=1748965 RepID=A0A653A870_UNCDX|nr:(R)-2-hydroxyacyl-CoA dehydratase [uncultured Desulfatiglans sp.]